MKSFNTINLSPDILKAIDLLNMKAPTQVQEQVIPLLFEGRDFIVKSQTGSGKTASFAIPICQLVDWEENKPQALVLVPTRELAIQVRDDIFNLGRFKRIKVSAVFGKSPFYYQQQELKAKTHVVVGTPGRIIEHLEKETLDTSMIRYLVLDEADRMLDMGFIEQIEAVISYLPSQRVTVLLSATLPKDIVELAGKYMQNPAYVEIEDQSPAIERIKQEVYLTDSRSKLNLLKDITIRENPDSCIIFCNTQLMVDELQQKLQEERYSCRKIHGGMTQQDRTRVMTDFKLGYFRYLVATDVAARGIDVDNLSLIINYDIPEDSENYVHRIGRTGRLSNTGKAVTLMTKYEDRYLEAIQEYIGKEIEQKEPPAPTPKHISEFQAKNATAPKRKQTKGAPLAQEIMKIHINAGKKQNMRPVDIVGTLCNIPGMTAEDIGIIKVDDISTFVEVLNNKGEIVLHALQYKPLKGRIRKVSKVEAR
jgi:superfamily II DNA/RNA helicase